MMILIHSLEDFMHLKFSIHAFRVLNPDLMWWLCTEAGTGGI